MSQIVDIIKNEDQYMPPSELETSKVQYQRDGILPLQK